MGAAAGRAARIAVAAIACFVIGAAAAPQRLDAQITPADSAGVLVGVAIRLQNEGRIDQAMTLLRVVRDRYPDTPAAADAIRLLAEGRRADNDQSGRTELLVFGTTYGVALGIGIPIALKADDPESYGLGLLVGAPAGFLAARMYSLPAPCVSSNMHPPPGRQYCRPAGTGWMCCHRRSAG